MATHDGPGNPGNGTGDPQPPQPPQPPYRLTRTARAAMAVAARAREVQACVSLYTRPSGPGPTDDAERAQALRLVIAALASEHPGKPMRFAQVSVPARFVSGIATVLGAQGYSVVVGASHTALYRTITVWPAAVLRSVLSGGSAGEHAGGSAGHDGIAAVHAALCGRDPLPGHSAPGSALGSAPGDAEV